MNGNVMTYFSNFRNGMEILKQVLTQLLLYYTRFVEIVKRSYQRPPPFNSEIITTQEILYEIKKKGENGAVLGESLKNDTWLSDEDDTARGLGTGDLADDVKAMIDRS
ncbi:hypothetical protein PI124_g4717 [Phytophthora idaei]|nr:hypothetical protein PI125_g4382 [Phytophthora idaei]KAG3250643.1 hypothetical protein PI124_g4717 [Phytophthora idaei]